MKPARENGPSPAPGAGEGGSCPVARTGRDAALRPRLPGNLRASLNLYGCIPQAAEQTRELAAKKLSVPMMAWGGRSSFGSHCLDSAGAIAASAEGGVVEECGHWVFQERTGFICEELDRFWARHG